MSALPCINSRAADYYAARMGRDDARDQYAQKLADELEVSYQFDPEILSDAFADAAGTIGEYDKRYKCDPKAAQFLVDVRNATDDLSCMHLIRKAMRHYIRERAVQDAEAQTEKAWGEV